MKRHMKNNPDRETPSITKWKYDQNKKGNYLQKYSCLECRQHFFDKSNLNQHRNKHNYKCSICGKSFCNENYLKSDIQIHHYERKHAKHTIITNLSKLKRIKLRIII